ncbi:hypothetical protein EN859_034200 [Mesorhizobium sp. M00.F.Ca.ET.216.01.1.1]|nr:hypothetical protein EN859_034200 [Mesorhizobium sp. M00.F.Ca.ET.216.01.1.1]TIS53774.1 MAG: hypothetical protein E5W91_29840 [Mesorhizobium sp.]TIS86133.1 MAG: hypothetical protein E5W89_30550 [Mesorhizobium sp.]
MVLAQACEVGEAALKLTISPLVGEMPGRAEGGAVPPACQSEHNRVLGVIRNKLGKGWRYFAPLCPAGHLPP